MKINQPNSHTLVISHYPILLGSFLGFFFLAFGMGVAPLWQSGSWAELTFSLVMLSGIVVAAHLTVRSVRITMDRSKGSITIRRRGLIFKEAATYPLQSFDAATTQKRRDNESNRHLHRLALRFHHIPRQNKYGDQPDDKSTYRSPPETGIWRQSKLHTGPNTMPVIGAFSQSDKSIQMAAQINAWMQSI